MEGLKERARPVREQKKLLQAAAVVFATALQSLVLVVVVASAKQARSCGLRYRYSMWLFDLADLSRSRFWC